MSDDIRVVRIVLADDHALVLDGLTALLARSPDLRVVASAHDGERALDAVRRLKPDVLVLDLQMPFLGGLDCLRLLRTEQLPVRVLRRRVSESLDDSLLLRRFEVPFVGRELEFAELRTLFRDVRRGAAMTAFITGEAGIGKSRLAGEVLRLAALDGATVATYHTSAGDAFTPISTLVTVGHLLLSLPGALGLRVPTMATAGTSCSGRRPRMNSAGGAMGIVRSGGG